MPKLPEEIVKLVLRDFAPDECEEILGILSEYGTEPYHREQERVLRDLLALAHGERREVMELIERAKRDYRDVILWAEYPDKSRLDTPEKQAAFVALCRKFNITLKIPE